MRGKVLQEYIYISLTGSFALAAASVLGKVMLRYRICDAGLITWLESAIMGFAALGISLVMGYPFPWHSWIMIFVLSHFIILAGWFLNIALQEGDASQVVPLLGLKIPFAGLLAVLLLGETASLSTWFALGGAGGAVALFGAGRQNPAQGGHGCRPAVPMLFAALASLFFAFADIAARLSLAGLNSLKLVLAMSVLALPTSLIMLARRRYKVYRITLLDAGLIFLRGVLVFVAVLFLYASFSRAGGVIGPNIVYGTRGAFALIIGYLLNKMLRVSIERQGWGIYILRLIGTGLLFLALLLVLL